jgi:hypothetical protein
VSDYAPPLRPHRGTTILVLGILSVVTCQPLGIFAWVMANADLREMTAGRMDPSGRSNTEVGRILGIVGTVLFGLTLFVAALWLLGVVALFGLAAAR